MDLRKAIVLSRKLPAQHVETLWETVYKDNVKIDTLTSILAFYLHHRVYPPPVQKAFDTLLMAFTDSKVQRKMRTLLFQTVEEICHWLSPSCITETVRLSNNTSVVAELLPCFLINKDILLPDVSVYERLISALTSPGLSQVDRAKVLCFLMSTLPSELEPMLNKQLVAWLSYSRIAQTGSLFRSPDVTDVDGTPGMGLCTALSLVTTVMDLHLLSVVVFSNIRHYLYRSHQNADSNLINAVFTYCSSLVTQASKKPNSPLDKQLIAGVLEEVLMLMKTLVTVDSSCQGRCQLIVGNVQLLVTQLRITPLMVSIWEYQLSLGEDSSLTEKMLTSVIQSDYGQGPVSQRLAWVIAQYGSQPVLGPYLSRYTPNILKLIATHPSALIEEFLDIVPQLSRDMDLIVENLHCLLDLPLLSASICVHQTPLLIQAGIKVPAMVSTRQLVEAEHKTIYQYFMRTEVVTGQTETLLKQYPDYWSALWPLLRMGLVQVCSQVVPLLLDAFLEPLSSCLEANKLLVPALLSRVSVLCPFPSYQTAVFRSITEYLSQVCSQQPELLESPYVTQFMSITSHAQLCPQLYSTVIAVSGEHVKTETLVISMFETMEAVLREVMAEGTNRNMKLEITICTSLAKLASRSVSLIPRAIAAFQKLGQTVSSASEEEKEALSQHVKELIRILKNPRVASVVLSPSCKEDIAIAALMRVLFQFLE